MPEVIDDLRKGIEIAPVNSDEFSIAVTSNEAAKAQAINRLLITTLVD